MSKFRVATLTTAFIALTFTACTSSSDDTATADSGVSTSVTTDAEETATTDTTIRSSDEDLNEFVVSTTARVEDFEDIEEVGNQIVVAWWYPTSETTYNELANELLEQDLITEELANEWKSDGRRQVLPVVDEVEIVKMWPVRVATDNATFQISSLADGSDQETLTFIEFQKIDNIWKAVEVL